MVALHIITHTEENANLIIDFLIEEELIFETITIKEVVQRSRALADRKNSYLIVGITKALLFKHINLEINRKFKNLDITMYSLPIVDMDLEKQKELIEKTKSV